MTDSALIYICAAALAVALAVGMCARELDAKREASRALDMAEACASSWERQIDATGQCLAVLETVREADMACACWEVPR